MVVGRFSSGETAPVLDVLFRERYEARLLYDREKATTGLDPFPVVTGTADAVLQLQQHLLQQVLQQAVLLGLRLGVFLQRPLAVPRTCTEEGKYIDRKRERYNQVPDLIV